MSMNCTPERKDKCNLKLVDITRLDTPLEEEKRVMWCSYCGAVVVDLEVDGRTYPGYFKPVHFPEIAKPK